MRFFGHTKRMRKAPDEVRLAPVKVKTREALGGNYGPDSDKRLVLTAHAQDMIGLRPERTRREVFIAAKDLYALIVRRMAEADRKRK